MKFEVKLKPHGATKPIITYGVDDTINTITVDDPIILDFDLTLDSGDHVFFIEFMNKPEDNADMAVEIDSVTIEGMSLDRFKWAGKYYPVYPEPWASQQTEVLPHVYDGSTYMGWNGRWELRFTTPIFLWIHKLENLGWIYS